MMGGSVNKRIRGGRREELNRRWEEEEGEVQSKR